MFSQTQKSAGHEIRTAVQFLFSAVRLLGRLVCGEVVEISVTLCWASQWSGLSQDDG